MEKFIVTGMSCAACQARVERAVAEVNGVKSVSVSLLTNSMGVEGDFKTADVIKAVENAGYGASVMGEGDSNEAKTTNEELSQMLEDHETPKLKKRLILSTIVLLILMYVSMGHMMFHFPLPEFMHQMDTVNPIYGITQMILCGIVMVINRKFFVSGIKGMLHGAPNMDTLIALGSGVSFIYSVGVLIYGIVTTNIEDYYFESAAMILVFITIGKTLESYSKGKTTNALKSLIKLAPTVATIVVDGEEKRVTVSEVKVGDIFVVRPGDKVPVDGVVLEGVSAINESFLTGESMPIDKAEGSEVFAATINQSGFLKCKATKVGEDTSLSKVINLVADNAATKAPIAKLADTISGVFVPVVIGISVVTLIVWLILGKGFTYGLMRAISVLVVSCPCALGLATPVAIMVGNGVGAKRGILFKTAEALQELGRVDTVVLDKTGTITLGEPSVTDVVPVSISEDELVKFAASLESKSEHPLAKAVVDFATSKDIDLLDTSDFEALPGIGLRAIINGKEILAGNVKYVSENFEVPETITSKAIEFADSGKTPVIFTLDKKVIGLFAISDRIKEDSKEAIGGLKKLGLKTIMLTGDNKKTANAIGKETGVDQVISGVLPDGKDKVIKDLSKSSKVTMVGDGINDAPALISSHVGVAVGAGSDVAIESASVVLTKQTLMDLLDGIRLSKATYKVILQNLFWALFYNVILIPVAAGCYASFGITMKPAFGAAAMSISSIFVVTNALRLNFFKGSKAKESDASDDLSVTIYAKGLMCEHCEATCNKAMLELSEVDSAISNYKKGTITVKLNKNIEDKILRERIEKKGYKVKKIKHGQ